MSRLSFLKISILFLAALIGHLFDWLKPRPDPDFYPGFSCLPSCLPMCLYNPGLSENRETKIFLPIHKK